jgi:hypothetical protein
LCSAKTRRTASVVAATVRLAPVTGRIPRLTRSSSSSGRPRNWSYQPARGRYSCGSAKARTSVRATRPSASSATNRVSGSDLTLCVSSQAVPMILPSRRAVHGRAIALARAVPDSASARAFCASVRYTVSRFISHCGKASASASSAVRNTLPAAGTRAGPGAAPGAAAGAPARAIRAANRSAGRDADAEFAVRIAIRI